MFAVRTSMRRFSPVTVARVTMAVLATCAFLWFGYVFLNAMINREWLRAIASVTIALAAIPWASHETDARNCLCASIAMSFGAIFAVAAVLLYFKMFDFEWFERIFNDKRMGPLGMFLSVGVGFAFGGYATWRLLALTPLPSNGSMSEFFAVQPSGEQDDARETSAQSDVKSNSTPRSP